MLHANLSQLISNTNSNSTVKNNIFQHQMTQDRQMTTQPRRIYLCLQKQQQSLKGSFSWFVTQYHMENVNKWADNLNSSNLYVMKKQKFNPTGTNVFVLTRHTTRPSLPRCVKQCWMSQCVLIWGRKCHKKQKKTYKTGFQWDTAHLILDVFHFFHWEILFIFYTFLTSCFDISLMVHFLQYRLLFSYIFL